MALISGTLIAKALIPYLVDLLIDVLSAEKDEDLDTGYRKHDYVMKKTAGRISLDEGFDEFENREIMAELNPKIKAAVKMLKDNGIIIRADEE